MRIGIQLIKEKDFKIQRGHESKSVEEKKSI